MEVEWPPRSGRVIRVPEIDRVLWARPAEARRRLNPAQAAFVDRCSWRSPGRRGTRRPLPAARRERAASTTRLRPHAPCSVAQAPTPSPRRAADRVDVAVIGAGIVGLATALRLLEPRPDLRLVVLERRGSRRRPPVRSQLRRGPRRAVLRARAPRRRCSAARARASSSGTARSTTSRSRSPASWSWPSTRRSCRASPRSGRAARRTAWTGSRRSGPERIREIEPHVAGIRALWSPRTGITDFTRVTRAYADDVAGSRRRDRAVAARHRDRAAPGRPGPLDAPRPGPWRRTSSPAPGCGRTAWRR